ncbi:MAG: hypothetical protein EZS28_053740, partial [Streblomastix strix]
RNADGTAKIGIYDTNKCIFSHCKVGYYRKNVQVNGSFIDQCIEIPLAYKETREEMTPDQSEDIFTDEDVCGDQCFNITSGTPTDLCPCPKDPGKLDDDPRKDGLCKCKNIIETTPVNACACPTDQQKLDQDTRKDGLCQTKIIFETTPTDICIYPTNPADTCTMYFLLDNYLTERYLYLVTHKILKILEDQVPGTGSNVTISNLVNFLNFLKVNTCVSIEECIIAIALLQRFAQKQMMKG